jgi:hypothetical protein
MNREIPHSRQQASIMAIGEMVYDRIAVGASKIVERVDGLCPNVSWRPTLRDLSKVVASVVIENVPLEDPTADFVCIGFAPSIDAADAGLKPFYFVKDKNGDHYHLAAAERELDREPARWWWAIAPIGEEEAYRELQAIEAEAKRLGFMST